MSNDVIRLSKGLNSLIEEYRTAIISSCERSKSVFLRDEFLTDGQKSLYIDSVNRSIENYKSMSVQDLLLSSLACAIDTERKYFSEN